MKILLATPIYPPQIGGPAQYVKNLEKGLKEKGIEVEVISYNNLKKYSQPLRFFLYSLNLFKRARNIDMIYTFNLISCGLPTYLVGRILRKKFMIRLGGDFLWERAIEEGRTKRGLREYYKERKSLKEKFFFFLLKKPLNGADKIVFTTNFQKELYKKYFDIIEEKTVIISNPFPKVKPTNSQLSILKYQFLYAGRLIKLKNLDNLIEVFVRIIKSANIPVTLKIIGEGPERDNLEIKIKNLGLEEKIIIKDSLPHSELLKEIQKSYLCVLPSLTEISPNFALECIKLRKPLLLTKETGIYNRFKNHLIFIDPQRPEDVEEKILYLLDEENYRNYVRVVEEIDISWSWQNVIEEHLTIFKNLCSIG